MAFLDSLDSLGSYNGSARVAGWANRSILISLTLFALSIPHSIAAAHVSLNLSLLGWIFRDAAAGQLHFARTRFDLPILCFSGVTVLSAVFSEEPSLSLRKLLSLSLFGVIYLFASNLSAGGVRWVLAALLISSLAGAGFSLGEKLRGRGITVIAIETTGPLAGSGLSVGDVIWMVARHRVTTAEDVTRIIRERPLGERVEIEAIHEGDPLPVTVRMTEAMRSQPNPLGLTTGGASRRFRASGFSRHFLTFAEQMQIMALLTFGGLLVALSTGNRRRRLGWLLACGFSLLSVALVLAASRAVMVSFLAALVLTALLGGRRRAIAGTLAVALLLAVVGTAVLISTRKVAVAQLLDDSSSRRVGYMRAGLRLIPSHPLLGVGMDAHKLHWREWGFPGDYITHTHSTPIQIALDRGLPALACLIWIFVAMAIWLWRRRQRAREGGDHFGEALALGTLGALGGFSASSLFNYNFGDSDILLLLLGLMGLAVAWFDRDTESVRVPE